MCGFLGVVRRVAHGPVAAAELAPHAPWLAHRGPDGPGTVARGGLGLLATRLAIQGDAGSRQPLVSASGRVALAFNGEILASGRRTLRALLAGTGAPAPVPAAGDTALLLAVLARALEAAAVPDERLLEAAFEVVVAGMGALALLDLERGAAWLVRDRFGVKPLYVLEDAPRASLWFASELEPLLRVAGPRPLDLAGVVALLRWHRPGPRLPFRDVRAVPPRSVVRTSVAGGADGPPPAHVAPVGTDPLARPRRPAAEAEDARRTFAAALARSAREAAQVGGPTSLFLSGGLDSAAVAVAASRNDLLALTGRFAPHGGPLDESDGAAAVARVAGLAHEVLDLEDGDLLGDLPDVVRALELPVAGPGSLALWPLFARAREHGRVVLTGTGGDELLGGYARVALALGRPGPWTVGYEPLAARLAPLAGVAARVRAAHDRSGDLAPLLAPSFTEALVEAERGAPLPEGLAEAAGPDDLALALGAEVRGTLAGLLQVEDRLAGALGLEARPVFCLGDLPDAALALPPDEVVGPDGEGKRALRAVLRGRVPEVVRTDARKRGFPTPFARAARGAGRERAEALLCDARFAARGWWDVARCRALLDDERPLHDRALFQLLSVETWARLYLDGDVFALPPRGASRVPLPR
jgi:asparagine synthase (glutamine-hydrolysing)